MEKANKELSHKVRNSIVNLKLLHKNLGRISLDIEKALNNYHEMFDEAVNENAENLPDGENSKVE